MQNEPEHLSWPTAGALWQTLLARVPASGHFAADPPGASGTPGARTPLSRRRGEVQLELMLAPLPAAAGLEFVVVERTRRDHPERLPEWAVAPIEQGALHACLVGGHGGLPLRALRVELRRGRIDRTTFDTRGLFIAAYRAVRQAILAAGLRTENAVACARHAARSGYDTRAQQGLVFLRPGPAADSDEATAAPQAAWQVVHEWVHTAQLLDAHGHPLDDVRRWPQRRERDPVVTHKPQHHRDPAGDTTPILGAPFPDLPTPTRATDSAFGRDPTAKREAS